jgi:hypothetical protein
MTGYNEKFFFGVYDGKGREVGYRITIEENPWADAGGKNNNSTFRCDAWVTRAGEDFGACPPYIYGNTVEAVLQVATKKKADAEKRYLKTFCS